MNNVVNSILQDGTGAYWFGTNDGVTRYRPFAASPPLVFVDAVVADQRYETIAQLEIPSTVKLVTFELQARMSFATRPEAMVYRYRLTGYDKDWKNTRARRVEYQNLPRKAYVFEVQAVDRDLNYSTTPATVKIVVLPPYLLWGLIGGLGLSLIGLVVVSNRAIIRRRAFLREQQARLRVQEALNRELEEELQTAHDMQMGLMPKRAPSLRGFDIAGQCLTASQVGGDFFQYFPQDGKFSICLADVTGHAMRAAVPMVLFNGILESEIRHEISLRDLFARLNQTLYDKLDNRTFVCFAMGELDLSTYIFRLANCGCPYPYHYKAASNEITELQMDAYPLGIRLDTEYQVMEIQLAPGDYIVFCSDGIIEATNSGGEIFGFEQTAETIRQGCQEGLAAEDLIERVVDTLKDFTGDKPQEDDMTWVVARVE